MTREEAIKLLKLPLEETMPYQDEEGKEFEEAYKMAIQALEQEPTTKNDLPQTMEELFIYLTDKIPSWKVILIDKWTDFKVWLWIKPHKGADRWE